MHSYHVFDVPNNHPSADMAPTKIPNAPRGTTRGQSSHQVVSFTIRACPLPSGILKFILENLTILKALQHNKNSDEGRALDEELEIDHHDDVVRKPTVGPDQFWDAFAQKCREAGPDWEHVAERTWAFGPQKAGGCLLIDARKPKALSS